MMYENDRENREEQDSRLEERTYAQQSGWGSENDQRHNEEQRYQNSYEQHQENQWQQYDAGTQYNRMNMSHIPQEPVKKPEKKGSMAGKVAGITAAALLFGTVAGGTMFGVNTAGEYLRAQRAPKEETQVSVATAKAPEPEETPSATVNASFALQTDVSSIVESAARHHSVPR